MKRKKRWKLEKAGKLLAAGLFLGLFLILTMGAWNLWRICGPCSYQEVIRRNWGIVLPEGCTLVYETDSGPSFHGDGERYHVFDCQAGTETILPAEETVATQDELWINQILSGLSVDRGYYPDLSGSVRLGRYAQEDRSRMYILYDGRKEILYVIESFL